MLKLLKKSSRYELVHPVENITISQVKKRGGKHIRREKEKESIKIIYSSQIKQKTIKEQYNYFVSPTW